jgi:hypothetical protein
MKIIFTDTNKIFGLYRSMVLKNSDLSQSPLVKYIHEKENMFVSIFVLDELEEVCLRK